MSANAFTRSLLLVSILVASTSNVFANAFFIGNWVDTLDVVAGAQDISAQSLERFVLAPASVEIEQTLNHSNISVDVSAVQTAFVHPLAAGVSAHIEKFNVSSGPNFLPNSSATLNFQQRTGPALSVVSEGFNYSYFFTKADFTGVLAPGDSLFWQVGATVYLGGGQFAYEFGDSGTINAAGPFAIRVYDVGTPHPNPWRGTNYVRHYDTLGGLGIRITKNGTGVSSVNSLSFSFSSGTEPPTIPEPSTLFLFAIAAYGCLAMRHRFPVPKKPPW